MPPGWEPVETRLSKSIHPDVRTLAQTLSLTFGSDGARVALRGILNDQAASRRVRAAALESLVGVKDPELAPILQRLLREEPLRGAALRALGGYNNPDTPAAILEVYATLDETQKRDALNTLVSRPAYAEPLLNAVAAGAVPRQDLTADVIRQLRTHKDPALRTLVSRVYGAAREVTADKQAEIERYRNVYRRGGSQPGDASRGRVAYNKVCAQCHILFDTGGKVGPNITGANRTDLNYLLETIVDPNAVIPNDYQSSTLETKDDRVMTGIVKSQDENSVTIVTANETVTIPRNEIASLSKSQLSMMPDGLLDALSEQEVRDLIYYLSRPGQVPMAAGQ
jgi:putative heme-binding domain-containing protein